VKTQRVIIGCLESVLSQRGGYTEFEGKEAVVVYDIVATAITDKDETEAIIVERISFTSLNGGPEDHRPPYKETYQKWVHHRQEWKRVQYQHGWELVCFLEKYEYPHSL
jgi:hypothetical protein